MNWYKQTLTLLSLSLFAACGDDGSKTAGGAVEDQEVNASSEEIVPIENKTISGVSQKGPFVNGSSVTVQELDGESLVQTGNSFKGKIKNDQGEFSVNVKYLASQFALLEANGFYNNEVTGAKSKSQVTLYALTDLSNRSEVNVNLLTHLAYERSIYLALNKKMSVKEAKKQAEMEVLKNMGIDQKVASAEDLNIFGTSNESAALLAVSVLMQGNLEEGDFSKRLADYAADIEEDGVWDDEKTATAIADWAAGKSLTVGLSVIRQNIEGWDESLDVPDFEKFVNNFWWKNYKLGSCTSKRDGEIKKNGNSKSAKKDMQFICANGAWLEATELAKDTYTWTAGEESEARYGDSVETNCYVFEENTWRSGNESDCSLGLQGCTASKQGSVGKGNDKVWYICDESSWQKASTMEKDTYGWEDVAEGTIKKGNVTDTVYVFDSKEWRVADDIEAELGGCVKATADSVGKVGNTYYICKKGEWTEAEEIEYDTYRWEDGEDGDAKWGDVYTAVCYVYEDDAWRRGDANDCSLGFGGCTKARKNEEQTKDGKKYVCSETSGNYNWKVVYSPDGTCAPSKTSITKGETVNWVFTPATLSGTTVTEFMEYQNFVKNSTCDWTLEGATPATSSGKCGASVTAGYSAVGSFSASVKLGEKTRNCGTVTVSAAPITGCSCTSSTTQIDMVDDNHTATWTVSCTSSAPITSYTWTGATGTTSSATVEFTEAKQSVTPSVQVSNGETTVDVTCSTVVSVDSGAPEYTDP